MTQKLVKIQITQVFESDIKLHFVQQNYNIHIILYSIFWKNTWVTFKQKHENIVTTYKKLKSPITK